MSYTDYIYKGLLRMILSDGDKLVTRNAEVTSHTDLPNTKFVEFPLVTVRKTAAMKSIKEMEWFFSGNEKCPEHLLDWWDRQLSSQGTLIDGYPKQFRRATFENPVGDEISEEFDQVNFILNGLKNSPNSRRLLLTMWNAGEMANITESNGNGNTPTCCHSIVVQFFVRSGKLYMKTYQRSADMLLGVPHNWVQSWAMLLYFAYHSGLQVGSMIWMWGDAHIYSEESHMAAANAIIKESCNAIPSEVSLEYAPQEIELDDAGVPIFKASDFKIIGTIPEPLVTGKINLL